MTSGPQLTNSLLRALDPPVGGLLDSEKQPMLSLVFNLPT